MKIPAAASVGGRPKRAFRPQEREVEVITSHLRRKEEIRKWQATTLPLYIVIIPWVRDFVNP